MTIAKRKGRPRKYADREKDVMAMLRSGMAVREIERQAGIPKSIVHRLSQEMRSA